MLAADTTPPGPLLDRNTKSKSVAPRQLRVVSYVFPILRTFHRQLTSLQVDANGKSCSAGGGTIVLESHGTVYGPGGQ